MTRAMSSYKRIPGVVFAFLAFTGGGAHAQSIATQRDGAWLQNGIEPYRRLNERESLSDKETDGARAVTSYVCAVVDFEKYVVFRADLLKRAVAEAKKHGHVNPQELKGIQEALPILIPLMQTRYFEDSPSCDKALSLVRDYLVKYPEVLDKDAAVIVERALMDAYPNATQP
jgi:hypothetical protein